MNENTDLSSIEQKVRAAYQGLQPDPAFTARLRGQIAARVSPPVHRQIRQLPWFSRLAVVGGAVVLALVFIFTTSSPSVVAQAVRQLLGYIPGMGVVDRSAPLRVLAEPVSQTREGVAVTVQQVFAGPERTAVQIKIAGIPASAYPQHLPGSDPSGFQNGCGETLYLRLPDGTTLARTGYNAISGHIGVPEYQMDFTVAPLPAEYERATLVMPCILGTELGTAPENWELPLQFVPAPDDMQMAPVIDLQTTASSQQTLEPGSIPSHPAAAPANHPESDITIEMEKEVPLPDGNLLYGSLVWGDTAPYSAMTPDMYTLTDSSGQRIPMFSASPDPAWMPSPGSHRVPLAFKLIGPVNSPGPLTFTLDSVDANLPVQDVLFSIDTGPDPQVNQQWRLDRDIEVAGYTIHLTSVTRTPDGYDFAFENPADVLCVDLVIQNRNPVHGQCGNALTSLSYDGDIPSGNVTVRIANLDVHLAGPWQVSWTP